jgi:hypothetical protein
MNRLWLTAWLRYPSKELMIGLTYSLNEEGGGTPYSFGGQGRQSNISVWSTSCRWMIYVRYVLNLSPINMFLYPSNIFNLYLCLLSSCYICISFLTLSLHPVPAVPNHHAIFCPHVTYANNFLSLTWPTLHFGQPVLSNSV